MRKTLVAALLVAACGGESDPMPYLNSSQRACLAQVKSAVRLQAGQDARLFINRQGEFTGAVTENGFVRYRLDSSPYDQCVAQAQSQQAVPGISEAAPGAILSAEDKALWDSLTPAQRERALTFLANGSTIQSVTGRNLNSSRYGNKDGAT